MSKAYKANIWERKLLDDQTFPGDCVSRKHHHHGQKRVVAERYVQQLTDLLNYQHSWGGTNLKL